MKEQVSGAGRRQRTDGAESRDTDRSHRLMRLAGMLAAVCGILFSITLIIFLTAGNGGYLGYRMLQYAPPEVSRLPAGEYPGVGEMTAGYLTGRTERFQYEYTGASGETITCFHDYEETHMADCRGLIRLDRTVMLLSGGLLLVLAGGCVLNRRAARDFCRGILWGLRVFAAAAAVLAVWAAADFDGFFITFHRVAFTNDGWLLNPGTDMLIRLMPTDFFISLGLRGAGWALIAPVLLWIAARIGVRKNDV